MIGTVLEGVIRTFSHALEVHHVQRVVGEVEDGTGGAASAVSVTGEGARGTVLYTTARSARVECVVRR